MSKWRGGLRWPAVTLGGMLLLAVCEIGYLLRINSALGSEVQSAAASERRVQTFAVGDEALAVTGFDLSGRRTSVDLRQGKRTLLITFSVGCQACVDSLQAFRRLAQSASAQGLQVVFVSKDYLVDAQSKEFARLPGTLICEPTFRTYYTARLFTVPQAAVINGKGRVEEAVVGTLDASKELTVTRAIAR